MNEVAPKASVVRKKTLRESVGNRNRFLFSLINKAFMLRAHPSSPHRKCMQRAKNKNHLNDKLYEFLKVVLVVGYLSIKMAIYIKTLVFALATTTVLDVVVARDICINEIRLVHGIISHFTAVHLFSARQPLTVVVQAQWMEKLYKQRENLMEIR